MGAVIRTKQNHDLGEGDEKNYEIKRAAKPFRIHFLTRNKQKANSRAFRRV
jgi:hypothetical protein